MEILTTIRDLPKEIKDLGISPDTPIKLVILETKTAMLKQGSRGKKGKWAKIAEEIAEQNLLNEEDGTALRKASKEFRDGFRFRDTPNFEKTGNEDD